MEQCLWKDFSWKSEGELNRQSKNFWCWSRSSANISSLTGGRQRVKLKLCAGTIFASITNRINPIYAVKNRSEMKQKCLGQIYEFFLDTVDNIKIVPSRI